MENQMKAFLITVRNIAILSVLTIVGIYAVVIMQINGTLPESELSQSVVANVVSKMENQ
jgi:hypothetical protein